MVITSSIRSAALRVLPLIRRSREERIDLPPTTITESPKTDPFGPPPENPFTPKDEPMSTNGGTSDPIPTPKPTISERYYTGADPAYIVPSDDPNITEARRRIAEARGKLLSQEQQIISTKYPTPTRTELARQTPLIGVKRKDAMQRLESQKFLALGKIKKHREEVIQPFEKEVDKAEAARKAAQARIIALNAAIATYARTGDADDIRKYGKDISKEAVKYVESHQTRSVVGNEPVYSGEYIDPSGVGMSVIDIRDIDTSAGGTFTPIVPRTNIRGETIILGGETQKSDLLRYDFEAALEQSKQPFDFNEYAKTYGTPSRETYQVESNLFVSTATGMQDVSKSTLFMRPPTPDEQIKIDDRKLRTDALLAVPGQYFGTIYSKELTPEQVKASTGFNFLNPKFQYDVALTNEEIRKARAEWVGIENRINKAKDELLSSGITEAELTSGNIERELTAEQKAKLKRYNAVLTYATGTDTYKTLTQDKSTLLQDIATSKISEGKKTVLAGTTRVTQTIPWLLPQTRIIMGADLAREGTTSYDYATTDKERAMAVGQTALGIGLAYSGVRGVTPASVSQTGSGGISFIGGKAAKIGLYGVGTGVGVGFGVYDYTRTLEETGSKSVALGAALGTGGTILGSVYGPAIYTKGKDIYKNLGKIEVPTPKIGDKPFIRSTRGRIRQETFYERAAKVRILSPSTWKYRGRKPGTFYKRQYRQVDPKVEGKVKGLDEVTYYDIVDGKVVQKKGATKTFPTDKPQTHLEYFQQTGIQRYYIPKKFISPEVKKEITAAGFTAYPSPKIQDPKFSQYQTYVSGKGLSVYFFGLGDETGQVIRFGGGLPTSTNPTAYRGYFKKAKVNPAEKELRNVPNPYVEGGKPIKQYKLTQEAKAGELQVPGYKSEVEGVVYGETASLSSNYYVKLLGRRIPIQEEIYLLDTSKNVLSSTSRTTSSSKNIITDSKTTGQTSRIGQSKSDWSFETYIPTPKISPSSTTTREFKLDFRKNITPSTVSYSISDKPSTYKPSYTPISSSRPSIISSTKSSVYYSSPIKYSTPSLTSIPSQPSITSRPSVPSRPSYTPPRIPPSYPPYYPPPTRGRNFGRGKRKTIKKVTFGGDNYVTQVRRRGKWFDLAKAGDLVSAKIKGVRFARKTLGASFRIKKDDKLVKIKTLPIGFRPAKKEKFVYVQKRAQRLKARSETREIIKSQRRRKWL